MARRKPKPGRGVDAGGRSKKDARHVRLYHHMLGSAAWRSLSPAAVKVCVALRECYSGYNNGQITLPLEKTAARLHMGKSTVSRALTELQDKGFIRQTSPGQWHGGWAATYALTDIGYASQPPTNDWQRWRPPTEKQKPVPEVGQHRPVSGMSG